MKFGRDFQQDLEKGDYPQEWIDSAIPYRKLKKCIKKVQLELLNLGLDHETLLHMYRQKNEASGTTTLDQQERNVLRYTFKDGDAKTFIPKLTIALDPRDGSPMDAWLSPETRKHLRNLTMSRSKADGEGQLEDSMSDPDERKLSDANGQKPELGQDIEIVEVPLTADSEFFRMLRREVVKLERLQKRQQEQLIEQIHQLGHELSAMKSSKDKKAKANIEAWREIFRLYNESQIFFSSHEQDAGARDVAHAQKQLQLFSNQLTKQQGSTIKLDGSAKAAMDRFLRINLNLLQFLRFQDINRTALAKIMKKFDKRTALPAQESMPKSLSQAPFIARDLAKATTFTISEELLSLIPQLDDYLCPVCFSISFKPVRLRCQHVFCIRCLIVMQRAEQDHCPLCREKTVLEASSLNLDKKLQEFLKANFPAETKAKQRENEFAAGVDRFGEDFKGTHKCIVM